MQLLKVETYQLNRSRNGVRHAAAPAPAHRVPKRSIQHVRALGGNDERSPDERLAEVNAMQEAAGLYAEAQKASQQQVLQELMQLELTDMQTYSDDGHAVSSPSSSSSPSASTSSSSGSSSSTRSTPSRPSSTPGATRYEPVRPAPSSLSALVGFWVEQGLSQGAAERVSRELLASGSRFADTGLLAIQLQRLARVIPSRVQDMVVRDLGILEASAATVAAHYVALVQLFPSSLDVTELAVRYPKLLYCDNLQARYEAVLQKLVLLHPSHSKSEAQQLLVDYPELIFRIPQYYMHVRTLDELPIEIQNNIIHTGQGLAQLHQMYNKGISPHFL